MFRLSASRVTAGVALSARLKQPLVAWQRFSSRVTNGLAGYVFDVDGVLLRGKRVLDPGRAAMHCLYDARRSHWNAPVVFLTNGGGTSEAARGEYLSSLLHVPIDPSQMVLSHSPMRMHVGKLNREGHSIITVGGPHCPAVARDYGFHRVLDIEHLGQARHWATPFAKYHTLPPLSAEDSHIATLPVSAVLVMSDSRELGRDLQLIVDIVADHEGTRAEQARVVFANPDLTFPTEFGFPRLAGGVLRVALDAVLRDVSIEKGYTAIQMGKPHRINFDLAEEALRHQMKKHEHFHGESLEAIYMIGDNPKSDVRGANARGRPWHSILVRSGNFRGEENDPTDPADMVVDDAYKAIEKTKRW
jgi:HAD superfamily hydrolase (TIGR01456 family)